MVAEPRSRLFTVADYDALPDDGPRYELIDGVLIDMPAPTIFHQRVLRGLFRLFDRHVTDADIGEVFMAPVDVEIMQAVVQPDLLYVADEHEGTITARRVVGAPELVVEILSPSTATHDLGDKRDLYQAAGVREYWLIDLGARTANVWTLDDGRYEKRPVNADGHYGSGVLSGFTVDLNRVFADADRQR